MTDIDALVRDIHDATDGGWREVARLCANGREYSPAYYQRIADGTLEPSEEARRGILHAASEVTPLLSSLSVFRWWDSLPDSPHPTAPADGEICPKWKPGGNRPAIARAAARAAAELEGDD